jgi:hypothetical protein
MQPCNHRSRRDSRDQKPGTQLSATQHNPGWVRMRCAGCCQTGACNRVGLDVTRAFCRRRGSGGQLRHRPNACPAALSRAPEASAMRGCGGDVWCLAMSIVNQAPAPRAPPYDHLRLRPPCPSSASRRRLPDRAQPFGDAVSGAVRSRRVGCGAVISGCSLCCMPLSEAI